MLRLPLTDAYTAGQDVLTAFMLTADGPQYPNFGSIDEPVELPGIYTYDRHKYGHVSAQASVDREVVTHHADALTIFKPALSIMMHPVGDRRSLETEISFAPFALSERHLTAGRQIQPAIGRLLLRPDTVTVGVSDKHFSGLETARRTVGGPEEDHPTVRAAARMVKALAAVIKV